MKIVRTMIVVFALAFGATRDAKASGGWEALGGALGDAVVAGLIIATVDLLVLAGGITTAIGNTVALVDKKRRPGWATAGFITGGLNIAMGGLFTVLAAGDISKNGTVFGLGLTQIVLGGTNILLGILNRKQLETSPPRLSLSPFVSPFGDQTRATGLAITFTTL